MNVTIIGRKCTPRDSFKERAEKKLAKIDKFFGESTTAKVTATAEKTSKIVEITVNNGGMIFRAEEQSEDMVEALDVCIDSLIRQIRKNKTRVEKKLRSGAFDDFLEEDAVAEETEFEIVRIKSVPVKPQSVEEAILQMNLLGHQFYLFTNAESNSLALVYRRKGHGYGLIEPEY